MRITNRLLTAVSVLTVLACFLLPGASSLAAVTDKTPAPPGLAPFEAKYAIRKAGMTVAEGRYNLRREGEIYTYSAMAEPKGVLGVFTAARAMETSHLEWTGERLRPLDYRYELENGDDSKYIRARYDWQSGIATIERKGGSKTLAIPANAVNSFILNLVVMLDLARNAKELAYPVVGKKRIKTYDFKRIGKERIQTEAGEFDAVVLESVRIKKGEKRVTRYWCAPALQYLPIRAVLESDNGGGFDMELLKVQGLSRN